MCIGGACGVNYSKISALTARYHCSCAEKGCKDSGASKKVFVLSKVPTKSPFCVVVLGVSPTLRGKMVWSLHEVTNTILDDRTWDHVIDGEI